MRSRNESNAYAWRQKNTFAEDSWGSSEFEAIPMQGVWFKVQEVEDDLVTSPKNQHKQLPKNQGV